MPQVPIGASEYYDALPASDHQPGDIWLALPTYGVLPRSHVAAIVVTPACDLANRKVETITYLPVISVQEYLCSRSFLFDILRYIEGQLSAGGIELNLRSGFSALPTSQDLNAATDLVNDSLNGKRLSRKENAALSRVRIGLELAIDVVSGRKQRDGITSVRTLLSEREYSALARKIVTNSHRPDIHFLPFDEQPSEWSAVSEHSVALFRYPMSLPVDILDLANSSSLASWRQELGMLSPMHPCAVAFLEQRPIKPLRVRPRFISDLLTRFTGLYGRLGSPDFSSVTIDRYVVEISEAP